MNLKLLRNFKDLEWKRVLLRAELNVSLNNDWVITDDTRIKASLPTINYLISSWVKLIICAHLWRPKWERNLKFTLKPVCKRLSELLEKNVIFSEEITWPWVRSKINSMNNWEVILLENIRFEKWEEKNDEELSKELASLADIYVSDAFWAVHRAHCSTYWAAKYLDSYAWFLIENEVKVLSKVFDNPKKPLLTIVAWSKMETKIAVLDKFIEIADKIIVWWAIANTLLKAKWVNIWASMFEQAEIERAKNILLKWWDKIVLPIDAILSETISNDSEIREVSLFNSPDIWSSEKILDVWSKSNALYSELIKSCSTVIWNWPVWVYEYEPFAKWTQSILQAIKDAWNISILWWWDTVDAMNKFWFHDWDFYHVSTWWWASLEFLEWKKLPWLEVLE